MNFETVSKIKEPVNHILEYIETRHTKLWTESFLIEQPKATVIFASGSGEYRIVSMDYADKLAQWINSLGYNFVTFDKHGCGESSGTWSQVTMDILVSDFASLAVHVKDSHQLPVILMGHSEGSRLALEVATMTNNVVFALILRVCSSQYIEDRIYYQLTRFGTEQSKKDCERWQAGIEEIKQKVERQERIEGFLSDHPRTYWLSWLNRQPSAELIDKVKVPILVLNAEDDEFTPEFAYRSIHEQIARHYHPKSLAKAYKVGGHGLIRSHEAVGESEADKEIERWLENLWG